MRAKAKEKGEIADRLLLWFQGKQLYKWRNTYDILCLANKDLKIDIPDLWQGYRVLRETGRVDLNNPNGQKGARILSFQPVCIKGGIMKEKLEELRNQFATNNPEFQEGIKASIECQKMLMHVAIDQKRSYQYQRGIAFCYSVLEGLANDDTRDNQPVQECGEG